MRLAPFVVYSLFYITQAGHKVKGHSHDVRILLRCVVSVTRKKSPNVYKS